MYKNQKTLEIIFPTVTLPPLVLRIQFSTHSDGSAQRNTTLQENRPKIDPRIGPEMDPETIPKRIQKCIRNRHQKYPEFNSKSVPTQIHRTPILRGGTLANISTAGGWIAKM